MAAQTDRERVRRIKYFLGPQGTAHAPAKDDSDNPHSENFLPLGERTEREKARWWALHSKVRDRRAMGELDR